MTERFSGILTKDYETIERHIPQGEILRPHVTLALREYFQNAAGPLHGADIGAGGGETSAYALVARPDIHLDLVEPDGAMVGRLIGLVPTGRVTIYQQKAREYFRFQDDGSLDFVVSGWTLHNFLPAMRQDILRESYRILKPGGVFINMDKYLPWRFFEKNSWELQKVRLEVMGLTRPDLEQVMLAHEAEDVNPPYRMTERQGKRELREAGFVNVRKIARHEREAVIVAEKDDPSRTNTIRRFPF